ncbi:5639_t:CDS:2, partial [Gigaspora rosea]
MNILPTKPAFDWLYQKTKLYSKFYADTNDQRQFGAMIYNEKEELLERFIMWNHDFTGNQLFIIRFCCDSPYSTHLLIQQAIQEASLNVFEVEISERTESLPYLSLYADDDDN